MDFHVVMMMYVQVLGTPGITRIPLYILDAKYIIHGGRLVKSLALVLEIIVRPSNYSTTSRMRALT
jgi:hypothetical protein